MKNIKLPLLALLIQVSQTSYCQKTKIWLDSSSVKRVYTQYEAIKGLIFIKNLSKELLFCHGQSEYVYTEDFYDANVFDPNAEHNNPHAAPLLSSDDSFKKYNTPQHIATKERYKIGPRESLGPCDEQKYQQDKYHKGYSCLFPGMTYIIGGNYAQWFCFDTRAIYPNGEVPLGNSNVNYPLPPGKYTLWQSAGVTSCESGIFDWDFEIQPGVSNCDAAMVSLLSKADINYTYYKNTDSVIIATNKYITDFIDTCKSQLKIEMMASKATFHYVNSKNCKEIYTKVFGKIIKNRALSLFLLRRFIENTKVYGSVRDEKIFSADRFFVHKELINYLLKKDRILAETFFGDLYFNEVYHKDYHKWIPDHMKGYLFTMNQMEELHQLFK